MTCSSWFICNLVFTTACQSFSIYCNHLSWRVGKTVNVLDIKGIRRELLLLFQLNVVMKKMAANLMCPTARNYNQESILTWRGKPGWSPASLWGGGSGRCASHFVWRSSTSLRRKSSQTTARTNDQWNFLSNRHRKQHKAQWSSVFGVTLSPEYCSRVRPKTNQGNKRKCAKDEAGIASPSTFEWRHCPSSLYSQRNWPGTRNDWATGENNKSLLNTIMRLWQFGNGRNIFVKNVNC